MSNTSEPINLLNPTKCPFCGPSTLACGWGGHQPAPAAATRSRAAVEAEIGALRALRALQTRLGTASGTAQSRARSTDRYERQLEALTAELMQAQGVREAAR